MVGMMAPSAAPMILMYARVGRQWKAQGKPYAATGWFAAGYLLAWSGFSLAATFLQWGIERAALLDSRMASASNFARRNRTDRGRSLSVDTAQERLSRPMPVAVSVPDAPRRLSQSSLRGCLLLGLRHGGYCVGCCWVLMALLFVGRGDERALDCALGAACPFGETYAGRTMGRARCRHCMCGRRRLAAGVVAAAVIGGLALSVTSATRSRPNRED